MKIITWNVNGIRAIAKKGFFELLDTEMPDILCLQETKAHPDQIQPELLNPLGWISFWSSAFRPGYSGTATYIRNSDACASPKEILHGIGIQKFDSEGRFVVTDHGEFLLYNVYFPNGASGPERHLYKMEFLKKFTQHLASEIKKGREIILVGDYNIAPEEQDVYDPKALAKTSGFLPEERAWFKEFFSLGFVDLFRKLHSADKERFTWWSYFERARLANRGWRIDFICSTAGIAQKVKSCEILDEVMGSDHCPVMCELLP
jgi:exodeoxyribonuclease-3